MEKTMSAYDAGYQLGRVLAPIFCCGVFPAVLALTAFLIVRQVRRNRSN
jgi:hypothetical protein